MQNPTELIAMANLFIENENLLCALYTECAAKIPAFRDSWEILRKAEEEHARLFTEVRDAIHAAPDRWAMGKIYPQALQTSINNLKIRLTELQENRANLRFILHFLMDCEQSLIECDMPRAFQTEQKEFLDRITRIHAETQGHKNLLKTIIDRENATPGT